MTVRHDISRPMMADEAGKPRRLRLGRWLVGGAVLMGLYTWTWGPYGILRQWKTARTLEHMQVVNDSLRVHNKLLLDSIRMFQYDSSAIAGEARRQGLILPGEIAVRFVDTTTAP